MKHLNRNLGRLLLACILVLCMIVPSFAQRKGSFGGGRSGSTSNFSSGRSSNFGGGSFGKSGPSTGSGGTFGQSKQGSFGRQPATNTGSGSFGRQPAANTGSGSFGRQNTGSGSFGRSNSSTSSGWSRPSYISPRYHVGLSYHMTVMPSNRVQIWIGGQPAWYYPDYGYTAYQSNPYAFVGAYDPNGSYGPPPGGGYYGGPNYGLISLGFIVACIILFFLFRPRPRSF